MNLILIIVLLHINFVFPQNDQQIHGSSGNDKSSPLMWMVINQLERLETKVSKLQDKSEERHTLFTDMKLLLKDVKQLDEKISKFREENEEQKTQMNVMKSFPNDVKNLENKIIKLTEENEERKAQINVMKSLPIDVKQLGNKVSKLTDEYEERKTQINVMKSLPNDVKLLENKISKLRELYEESNTQLIERQKTLTQNIISLMQNFSLISEQVNKIHAFNDERLIQFNETTKSIEELQQLHGDLTKQLKGLTRNITDVKGHAYNMNSKVTCETGWQNYLQHCYYFAFENLTWYDAKIFCVERDADLVKINNAKENVWVGRTLKATKSTQETFWIGANDLTQEGRWTWVSDNSIVNYSNWWPTQPDDSKGDEDCALVYTVNNSFGWNDIGCTFKSGFICEK